LEGGASGSLSGSTEGFGFELAFFFFLFSLTIFFFGGGGKLASLVSSLAFCLSLWPSPLGAAVGLVVALSTG
jgi:hypothetical protein